MEKVVEQAYQAVRRRQERLVDLVSELWECKYRALYVSRLHSRKIRLDRIENDWVRFLR